MTKEDRAVKVSQACREIRPVIEQERRLRAKSQARQKSLAMDICKKYGIKYEGIKKILKG